MNYSIEYEWKISKNSDIRIWIKNSKKKWKYTEMNIKSKKNKISRNKWEAYEIIKKLKKNIENKMNQ